MRITVSREKQKKKSRRVWKDITHDQKYHLDKCAAKLSAITKEKKTFHDKSRVKGFMTIISDLQRLLERLKKKKDKQTQENTGRKYC